MNIDPTATKYMIKAKLTADGIVEKPDVVGAIFGQTEGLLGDELDLRDLQKSGRIGRIEVDVQSKFGKSEGIVYIASSLDQVETAIIASSLETIDRVGPCKAGMTVLGIEDVRIAKREQVIERAKELLSDLIEQSKGKSSDLTDNIRQSLQVEEITTYGKDHCPAGPNVKDSESIIIVEGRSDVLNLLRAGIKNAIAVEGTNIPETVQELSKEKVATAFVDGDRGGELILRELFQTAEVDFVARAPRAHEVEELSAKQLTKCLRNKVPYDQYMEMNGLSGEEEEEPRYRQREERHEERYDRHDREDRRDREERRRDREGRHDREDRRGDGFGRDRRERELREKRKDRFNTERADRFKKKDEDADEPVEEPAEESVNVYEEPVETVEESVEEVVEETVEEPVETVEEPVEEEKPKKRASKKKADEEEKPKKRASKKKADEEEEKPAKTTSRKKKEAARQTKVLSEEQQSYRDMLLDMASTHNAKILNGDNEVVREVAVKGLVDSLKEDSDGVVTIVFDGVISQRILDVSSANNIQTIVGTRKGNITKMPAGITILTKEDLY